MSPHVLFVSLLAATAVLHVQTTATSSSSAHQNEPEHNLTIQFSPKSAYEKCHFRIVTIHNKTVTMAGKQLEDGKYISNLVENLTIQDDNLTVQVECNDVEVAKVQHVNPSYAIHVDLEKKRWYQCKGESLILFFDGFEAYWKAAGHPPGTHFVDLHIRHWVGGDEGESTIAKGISSISKMLVKLEDEEKEMLKKNALLKIVVEYNGEVLTTKTGEHLYYNKLIKVDMEKKMLSQE